MKDSSTKRKTTKRPVKITLASRLTALEYKVSTLEKEVEELQPYSKQNSRPFERNR